MHPHHTLLEVLRTQLDLTGLERVLLAEGECGACTCFLNGRAIYSCLMLAVEADGAEVATIEGLCPAGKLDAVQRPSWKRARCSAGSAFRA